MLSLFTFCDHLLAVNCGLTAAVSIGLLSSNSCSQRPIKWHLSRWPIHSSKCNASVGGLSVCLSVPFLTLSYGARRDRPRPYLEIHLEAVIPFNSPLYFLNCMAFDFLTSVFKPPFTGSSRYQIIYVHTRHAQAHSQDLTQGGTRC